MRSITLLARAVLLSGLILNVSVALALDVKISKNIDSIEVMHNGVPVTIQRIQNQSNLLTGGFTKTSRKCPPFCIQPLHPAPGVTTVAELEVLNFMQTKLKNGTGIIIDARTTDWYKKGTIPGSINIPFTSFEKDPDSVELAELFESLGAVERDEVIPILRMVESAGLLGGDQKTEKWDFSNAKELLLWCNGPWCGQSPRAIRALLQAGYPAEKLYYYRGGMQMWQ